MDLGVMKLRCQGLNILQGAIHAENGLVWTDGLGIYLTPVSLCRGQLQQQEHNKLGEFDRGVRSVHWSNSVEDGLCYMCVVHERNISIWKVEGHQPKLAFKQVRKVNIQPIPQGCIWNPGRDILCVLCPQQASIYYSHVQNKGSQVLLQLERDKIRCGCWLSDGSRLVICIETTLMVYHWSDIDQSLTQYTHILWTVPGLAGRISAVTSVSRNKLVYAAELPLESLVKNQDTFVLPDLLNRNSNQPIGDGLTDSDVIIPNKNGQSLTDSLFNLPKNPEVQREDFSRLDCVEVQDDGDPVIVCSTNIQGILTPDILLFKHPETIIVGSNTQTWLQLFLHTDTALKKQGEICLYKDERPKGIASLPKSAAVGESGILLMVGKKDRSDAAFPSSTNTINMKSVLKFFTLKSGQYEKSPLTHTQSVPSLPLSVATNGKVNDYDLLTHSVMNFDTTLRRSVRDNSGKENYIEALDKPKFDSKDATVENGSPGNSLEIGDKNSKHESVVNGFSADVLKETTKAVNRTSEMDTKVRNDADSEAPVPPKRPVRKKRSLRQKELLSAKSSSDSGQDFVSNQTGTISSAGGEPAGKMAMEYMSDSPDMSPRELHTSRAASTDVDTKTTSTEVNSNGMRNQSDRRTCPASVSTGDICVVNKTEVINSHERVVSNNQKICASNGSRDAKQESNGKPDIDGDNITLNIFSTGKPTVKTSEIVVIGGSEDTKKELEVERTDFSAHERSFRPVETTNFCTEEEKVTNEVQAVLNRKLMMKETQISLKPSQSLESLDDIDRILKEQNKKICELNEQMNKLSRRIDESSCVLPSRYQTASKPDILHLCFRCKDGFEIKKNFLLDNGRIQLDQIKQAFSLSTVEIIIDGDPCVAGCNIDGYIPMRFETGSTVYISGKPALS